MLGRHQTREFHEGSDGAPAMTPRCPVVGRFGLEGSLGRYTRNAHLGDFLLGPNLNYRILTEN